jgi:hypothetical protein
MLSLDEEKCNYSFQLNELNILLTEAVQMWMLDILQPWLSHWLELFCLKWDDNL